MTVKRGFTDTCFKLYTSIWITILITSIILTIISPYIGINDLSVINTIVEKTTEAMMVFIGFIVWKAKCENMKKHNKEDSIEM